LWQNDFSGFIARGEWKSGPDRVRKSSWALAALIAALTALGTTPGGGSAHAAAVTVEIKDSDGKPVPGAVVSLWSEEVKPPAPGPNQTIDQKNETFVPDVLVVPLGGAVVFRNSDLPRHQIYSFSPAKRFDRELSPGQQSDPVVFDKPGIVALGCNIHDHMVAYLFVAASPHVARTGADGKAMLANVPDGAYKLRGWHPRLKPSPSVIPEKPVTVAGDSGLDMQLSLSAPKGGRDPERSSY
jgi:plastocyanin